MSCVRTLARTLVWVSAVVGWVVAAGWLGWHVLVWRMGCVTTAENKKAGQRE